MRKKQFDTIDEYIASFPQRVGERLEELRRTIKQEVPEAEEIISYQMPAFRFHGNLVYFAGYENHIGFYPTSSGIDAFKKELSSFKTSRGTVRLPMDRPLPLGLLRRIVRFRVRENLAGRKKNEL